MGGVYLLSATFPCFCFRNLLKNNDLIFKNFYPDKSGDLIVTQKYADMHLEIGIEAMTEIGVKGEKIKHFTY